MVYPSTGLFKDQFRTAQGSNSMASAERDYIRGSGCGAPSGGPEDRAPGGSSKGKASAPEAECLFVFVCPKEAANLPHY